VRRGKGRPPAVPQERSKLVGKGERFGCTHGEQHAVLDGDAGLLDGVEGREHIPTRHLGEESDVAEVDAQEQGALPFS
jgi:hypothetical protein